MKFSSSTITAVAVALLSASGLHAAPHVSFFAAFFAPTPDADFGFPQHQPNKQVSVAQVASSSQSSAVGLLQWIPSRETFAYPVFVSLLGRLVHWCCFGHGYRVRCWFNCHRSRRANRLRDPWRRKSCHHQRGQQDHYDSGRR